MKCEVISYESAITLLGQMPDTVEHVGFDAGDVYMGAHPTLGAVTLVIAAVGSSLLIRSWQ